MCGIVGYIGPQDATAIIVEGLRKLEYLGYDSAGVAVFDGNRREFFGEADRALYMAKAAGKNCVIIASADGSGDA